MYIVKRTVKSADPPKLKPKDKQNFKNPSIVNRYKSDLIFVNIHQTNIYSMVEYHH